MMKDLGLNCYAQNGHKVQLGSFECEGGSFDTYLATAALDIELG